MQEVIKKAGILVEAIPYIHAFRQKLFVVKYGGSILENETVRKYVLEDIVFLSFVGIRIILVHGGGPHISARLTEAGKKSEFHEGIRVTDEETLKVVSEELDKLNKRIVAEIKKFKGDVTGLKGEENIIHVEKKKASRDLGFVGTITSVDQEAITTHLKKGRIVVVSPMGVSVEKQPHNVNADEVASAIAISMKAEKLVALTDVQGVLREPGNSDTLISSITIEQVNQLIAGKIIQGGMIPKVSSCLEAVLGGVKKAHIVDARLQHALLLEIFTDRGVGTQILKE